jgi:transketolase
MTNTTPELDNLCVNTLRTLAVDAIEKANSGHPGLPLGAAPMAYVLWQNFLRHSPTQPHWPNRDRFVLSAGHGSSMLYALLHLTGYGLSMAELQRFRQWESLTPGHPEAHLTPGVEATTGPLGQGFTNAVGMAMAEQFLAATFNRPGHQIVDHMTYTLLGDGCIMEGVAMEAASLAGHLGLGRLIALYDANDITLDGPAEMAFTEDVEQRFVAHGWHVLRVEDGDGDLEAIHAAISAAKAVTDKPSLVVVKTTIGFGSTKAGTSAAHGAPFGPEGVRILKQKLGFDPDTHFFVPEAAASHFRRAVARGQEMVASWEARLAAYRTEFPELAAQWDRFQAGELPAGWCDDLPRWEPGEKVATRAAGGKVVNALAAKIPWLLGGDADLGSSTQTSLKGESAFGRGNGAGRNIHYGVREHAMAAIANGFAYYGGIRNFVSTFFVFADYMRPSIRLAAMNRLPVTYVWTHDSVAVGEDGPTHQPVEHLMALRTIPGLVLLRPADPNETTAAWKVALEITDRPVGLVLTRQAVPALAQADEAGVRRGAYVLSRSWDGEPDALLIASGSEVGVALEAQEELAGTGIHTTVVSMPSWELFAAQDQAYRDSVLPPHVTARVSVEAGITFGWQRWLGDGGKAVGIDRFGASAPGPEVMSRLGINVPAVVAAVRSVVK